MVTFLAMKKVTEILSGRSLINSMLVEKTPASGDRGLGSYLYRFILDVLRDTRLGNEDRIENRSGDTHQDDPKRDQDHRLLVNPLTDPMLCKHLYPNKYQYNGNPLLQVVKLGDRST